MPRTRAFILDAMSSLAQQLAFIPRETAVRQLECVRALHESIHRDDLYGWSDIEYQITRFRSEKRSSQADLRVVGASLARDLNELALRLSARAPHTTADAWTLDGLAKSWNVSARTLHRWRALGLLCCWVRRSTSRAGAHALVLGVRKNDAAAFRAANSERIARASAFSLMTVATREKILARASQVSAVGERRISTAARTISREVGRSRESVRALLKANPTASQGRLTGRARPDKRTLSIALAASMRGMGATQLAKRLSCSRARADRLVQQARGSYLQSVSHSFLTENSKIPATFIRADAREVLLAPPAVQATLLSAKPIVDAAEWMSMKPSVVRLADAGGIDSARMMAVRFLLFTAQHQSKALTHPRPTELALDRIDTDLRWARLILRTLLANAMPTLATRLKVWSGIDPLHFSRADGAGALNLAARTLVEVVLTADPVQIAENRIKLTRAVALAFDRRVTALAVPSRSGGSGEPEGAAIGEPLDSVMPWHQCAQTLARRVAKLAPSPQCALWHQRLGWDGTAPQTLAQIATAQRKPVGVIARALNGAINQSRKAGKK